MKAVKNWILNSGIQNKNGGFHSWFDEKNRAYPFIYSEITGYGITTLLYLNSIKPDKLLVERSKLAVEWLIKNAYIDGGFKTRYFLKDKEFNNNIIHIFDVGMILYGIINLYKITKDDKYLKISKDITKFILKNKKSDGLLNALYENGKCIDNQKKWSTQSGSYHAKVAMGLIELFEVTKDEKYKKSAESICNTALKFQKEDGRFSTFNEKDETHLHPHCYSAEGLLYVGIKLKNQKYINSALKATEWALSQQMENGGIPLFYNKDEKVVKYERTDILAQILRLGSLLKTAEEKLNKLKIRLLQFQKNSKDIATNGGIIFGVDSNGKKINHINSWCSMFTLQAISIYEDHNKKVDLLI